MKIPTVETARLRLRAHQLKDLKDCVAMWSDPIVTKYTIGKPSTEQQTWIRMTSYLGHWSLLGFGYWAVEEKSTGRFIGELGFADFKRGLEPSIEGLPEMGWALASHAHSKGYAVEALTAAAAWGDAHLNRDRTVCIINPENQVSIHIAKKIGFIEIERIKKETETLLLLNRIA
jgi:RimJ/RimL family protein N-acetyltransferase